MININLLSSIDTENGLYRVGGDLETYQIILEDYLNNYCGIYDRLISYLSSGKYEEAIRDFHTFKGVSGSIGSEKLYNLGKSIEELLKNNSLDKNNPILPELNKELNSVISQLNLALEISEPEELCGFKLKNLLLDLLESIIDKDYKSAKKVANTLKKARINSELKEDILVIAEYTGKYKFNEAKDLCIKVINTGDFNG